MLYHSSVFMPKRVKHLAHRRIVNMVYSNHAIKAASEDKYGPLFLPLRVTISPENMVEAEVYSYGLEKIVVRIPQTEKVDLCIAMKPLEDGKWLAKTVWGNEPGDNHATLDWRKYERKPR